MRTAIATFALAMATVLSFQGTAHADAHGVEPVGHVKQTYNGPGVCVKVAKQTFVCKRLDR